MKWVEGSIAGYGPGEQVKLRPLYDLELDSGDYLELELCEQPVYNRHYSTRLLKEPEMVRVLFLAFDYDDNDLGKSAEAIFLTDAGDVLRRRLDDRAVVLSRYKECVG